MNLPIDQLRRQAKSLKIAFASGDNEAIRRARAVISNKHSLSHSGALHVIAREQGFDIWLRIKQATESVDQSMKAGQIV